MAGWFHAGGEPSVRGHATNPAFESRHLAHGRHREDISPQTAFKKHLGDSEVTSPHGLANPAPVRFYAHTQQPLHDLDVALSKRCGQLGCNRCGLGAPVA
jgi:hypothetical protein